MQPDGSVPPGSVPPADGDAGPGATPDGGSSTGGYADLGTSFVRLGLIGSSPQPAPTRGWTLRLYQAGGSRLANRSCTAPRVLGGCVVEQCVEDGPTSADAGGVDAGPGTPWTGAVSLADETHPRLLQIDLATTGTTLETSVAVELGQIAEFMPGDVIRITTQNVINFPPIDLRLTIPSDAQIALAGSSLSQGSGTAFASVSQPGDLRLDLSRQQALGTTTASCFFDRTQSQHTLPALAALEYTCDPESSLNLLPIGFSQRVLPGPPQSFVYIASASTDNYVRNLTCVP